MDKCIPNADIRRAWLDPDLTTAQAAIRVGLSRVNLWKRAKNLGLPPRKDGRRPVIPEAELRALWLAEVLVKDIAGLYHCPTNSVRQASKRIGMDRRPTGAHRTITLEDYRAGLIRRANTPGMKLDAVERILLEKTRAK